MIVMIYQLKESAGSLLFADYSRAKPVQAQNYACVYTCERPDDTSLDDIFEEFNLFSPADFRGHSLSVSDVIVTTRANKTAAHYVNIFGFIRLNSFGGAGERGSTGNK